MSLLRSSIETRIGYSLVPARNGSAANTITVPLPKPQLVARFGETLLTCLYLPQCLPGSVVSQGRDSKPRGRGLAVRMLPSLPPWRSTGELRPMLATVPDNMVLAKQGSGVCRRNVQGIVPSPSARSGIIDPQTQHVPPPHQLRFGAQISITNTPYRHQLAFEAQANGSYT